MFHAGSGDSIPFRQIIAFKWVGWLISVVTLAEGLLGEPASQVPVSPVPLAQAVTPRFVLRPQLPPPPEGVTDFSLTELLVATSGGSGVDYSPRARQLDGKLVRVNGYTVRQATPIPWAILLSPVPQSAHEREYFLCDDLPISTIHVFFPKSAQPLIPFHPEMVAIIGRLELGGRTEADERTSMARVFVKPGQVDAMVSVTNLVRTPIPVEGASLLVGTNQVPSAALSKP